LINNIGIKTKYTIFENSYLLSICTKLSAGALFVLMSALRYYMENLTPIDTASLRQLTGFSKDTFRMYLSELMNKGFIEYRKKSLESGGYKNHIAFVFKDTETNAPTYGLLGDLGNGDTINKNETGQKISATKRRVNKKIKEEVIEPYIEELLKRDMEMIIHGSFRKDIFRDLYSILPKFRDTLSPKDILNILILALDNSFLKSIGKQTSLDLIFLNPKTSLVTKYVTEVKNIEKKFKVIDSSKQEQDEKEFGYFIIQGGKYVHIPPTNMTAKFYKISEEVEKRINGEINKEFDEYFDGISLKQEYNYMIGNNGKGNRFIGG